MQIYDISVPLCASIPVYPGDPPVDITDWLRLDKGDPANVSCIRFGAHTGTHVDAPAHFIAGGAKVESLPLNILIGEAEVFEVPDNITAIDGEIASSACATGASRILFKTRNSQFWNNSATGFRSDYTYLDADAARCLVDHGVKLVGIDYLSVEKFHSENFATHHALLSHGVVIIEGLDLGEVPAGRFELICLPLRIRDGSGDGAPARAVLKTLD